MENINVLLQFFILFPLLGFTISLIIPKNNESIISWNAFSTVLFHLVGTVLFIIYWFVQGCPDVNLKEITILQTEHYEFFVDFYFDNITATYLLIGTLLTLLVTVYSRYYLHREEGYKRFFNTILFLVYFYFFAVFLYLFLYLYLYFICFCYTI